MNYSDHFKEKDNEELLDLLVNRSLLNFEAQRCLLSEIQKRSLTVDEIELDELKGLIKTEESKIREFEYLPFLGFSIRSDDDTVIQRRGSARRVDIFSVLVAVVMMLAAMPLTQLITTFMEEGLTGAMPVVGIIVCLAIVVYGILLFLRSIDRIAELWRFQILKRDHTLQIKKGSAVYTVNRDLSSALHVLSNGGRTKLVLVQSEKDKPVTLMSTDGGLRLHLTLKHLRDYLVQ